ncbi:MAG: hypothetical protein ABIA04_10515 [Pseudomonadota bacterium]
MISWNKYLIFGYNEGLLILPFLVLLLLVAIQAFIQLKHKNKDFHFIYSFLSLFLFVALSFVFVQKLELSGFIAFALQPYFDIWLQCIINIIFGLALLYHVLISKSNIRYNILILFSLLFLNVMLFANEFITFILAYNFSLLIFLTILYLNTFNKNAFNLLFENFIKVFCLCSFLIITAVVFYLARTSFSFSEIDINIFNLNYFDHFLILGIIFLVFSFIMSTFLFLKTIYLKHCFSNQKIIALASFAFLLFMFLAYYKIIRELFIF